MKTTHIAALITPLFAAAAYAAPLITCPAPVTVPCSSTNAITVTVQDPAASDLGVVWSVNGIPMETNVVPGAAAFLGTNVSFTAILPVGTNAVDVTATDVNT